MKEAEKSWISRLKRDFIIPITIALNLTLVLSFILIIMFTVKHLQ
jgi:hypothetical protein